jgi:hypothetical protein
MPTNDAVERDGVIHAGVGAERLGQQSNQSWRAETSRSRKVEDPIARAVEVGTQVAPESGLAGTGLAGDEHVGFLVLAQGP